MEQDSVPLPTMKPAVGGKSFVTLCTYQERQDALKRTSMMEDDATYRTNRNFNGKLENINGEKIQGDPEPSTKNVQQQSNIPPPPPQFANSPPKSSPQPSIMYKNNLQKKINGTPTTTTTIRPLQLNDIRPTVKELKAPNSPIPDYDNIEIRSNATRPTIYSYKGPNMRNSSNTNSPSEAGNRRTMRLGTVTIGEYEQQQRKEPEKFNFIGNQRHNSQQNTVSLQAELQSTLSRSNLKKTQKLFDQHQSNCPLQNSYENMLINGNNRGNDDNVETLTRKLQHSTLAKRPSMKAETPATTTATTLRSSNGTSTGGILKNGSRSSGGGSFSKTTEQKSITFGN